MTILIDAAGWVAAAFILASYLLVSTGRLGAQSAAFQWMNVAGAGGFIVNSSWHGALPSAVLNIAWAGIGLFTLWRIGRVSPSWFPRERGGPEQSSSRDPGLPPSRENNYRATTARLRA